MKLHPPQRLRSMPESHNFGATLVTRPSYRFEFHGQGIFNDNQAVVLNDFKVLGDSSKELVGRVANFRHLSMSRCGAFNYLQVNRTVRESLSGYE